MVERTRLNVMSLEILPKLSHAEHTFNPCWWFAALTAAKSVVSTFRLALSKLPLLSPRCIGLLWGYHPHAVVTQLLVSWQLASMLRLLKGARHLTAVRPNICPINLYLRLCPWGVKLTTHLDLVPRLRMPGSIRPLLHAPSVRMRGHVVSKLMGVLGELCQTETERYSCLVLGIYVGHIIGCLEIFRCFHQALQGNSEMLPWLTF